MKQRSAALAAIVFLGLSFTAKADDRNGLERLVDGIPQQERRRDWLSGDADIWSGVASAGIIGWAVGSAGGESPVGGLGGQAGSGGNVVDFGDDLYTLIPATGYLTAAAARDWRGFAYLSIHNVASSAGTSILKEAVGQRRPGDQSSRSFPSGHTNTAFLGAAFLQQRYGPRFGVPAYISAFLVGWSRVFGNKHYVNDVLGGASIAMFSAWAIVPPYDRDRLDAWRDLERERRFRYEWEMTLNDVDSNRLQSPQGSGDVFRLPLDTDLNEPWANSRAGFEYRLDARRTLHGHFSPWEIRSFGRFTQPVTFSGERFPADTDLRVAHLMWNYGAQLRQKLIASERFEASGGLGLAGQYTEADIFVIDDTQPESRGRSARSDAYGWYGVLHGDVAVKLLWRLWLSAEIDVGLSDRSNFVDWGAAVEVRLNPKWRLGAGWRAFETDLDDDALRNDFKRSGFALSIGYAF